MKPKKYLGQNFLINPSILPSIINAAELKPQETVIEVGPGYGILTKAVLEAGVKVFAIEKDFDLIAFLTQKFGTNKNLKLVHQDALFFDASHFEHYKIVSNLPFNIASPIIRKFLESTNPPELMVVMVQKEVAEKIVAKPGNSERGVLTLAVEFYGQAEIISTVSKNSFKPMPKVDAAIIRIRSQKKSEIEAKMFFRVVKAGFAAKRQQIHNSLAATLRLPKDDVLTLLRKSGIDTQKRAEDLNLDDWKNLTISYQASSLRG